MKKTLLTLAIGGTFLIAVLATGPVTSELWAQPRQSNSQNSQDTGTKSDAKQAGRDTANAAKKTGSAVKKGTKKVVNTSAKTVKKGAGKVQDKTQPQPQTPPKQ